MVSVFEKEEEEEDDLRYSTASSATLRAGGMLHRFGETRNLRGRLYWRHAVELFCGRLSKVIGPQLCFRQLQPFSLSIQIENINNSILCDAQNKSMGEFYRMFMSFPRVCPCHIFRAPFPSCQKGMTAAFCFLARGSGGDSSRQQGQANLR